ncbi:MAG: alpha/beta hydrolase family protein, partial [Gemmatimonadales bacterium]
MSSRRVLLVVLTTLAACGDSSDPQGPGGEGPPAGCADGNLTAGNAPYRVCYPQNWNGDLVLYAHGYVPSGEPLAIVDDPVEATPISALVNSLGYAFATTSYRANGLVADVGVEDMVALRQAVLDRYRTDPLRTFVVGASEGGLVAALAAERYGDRFAGAVAACGPVGDFARQIDYLGDFRVVFDYFFPAVIPGTAVDVPDEVRSGWDNVYVPAVISALLANPSAVLELLQVTGAAADLSDINTVGATVVGLLWYDVFGISDARAALGGQPYDNTQRAFAGSTDDAAL